MIYYCSICYLTTDKCKCRFPFMTKNKNYFTGYGSEVYIEKKKPHEKVPKTVLNLCYNYKGLIIGGSVDYIIGNTNNPPKDIDVIIPHDTWLQACRLIPKHAKVNSFGGFKFTEDGIEVDVWMDNAAEVIMERPSSLLNLKTLKVIKS